MLNVRDVTRSAVIGNEEIKNLVQILGLKCLLILGLMNRFVRSTKILLLFVNGHLVLMAIKIMRVLISKVWLIILSNISGPSLLKAKISSTIHYANSEGNSW